MRHGTLLPECAPDVLSAERPNRDNWAVWLVPLFWLIVVGLLTIHDLRKTGESTAALWQVVAALLGIVGLLCIPLFVRTKKILLLDNGEILVHYYLRPSRRLWWADVERVDHIVSSGSGDRLIRLVISKGRPVLISRAMLNYERVEEAILSHPGLSIKTTPRTLDRWLHDASS